MDAIKLWLGLMAKRAMLVAGLVAVAFGSTAAWQHGLLTFSGLAAFAKTLVWQPGQPEAADLPNEDVDRPKRGRSAAASAHAGRVAASVGVAIFDGPGTPGHAPPLPIKLDRETTCLARAVYHEAAHDPVEVRIAIAHVAMVRLGQAGPKPSMCAVIYGGMNSVLGCLFVATCRNSGAAEPTGDVWRQAQEIAKESMAGNINAVAATGKPLLAEATHFHPRTERPAWIASVNKLTLVGRFVFLSRKPVEPGIVVGNSEPPPTQTVEAKSEADESKSAESKPAPKKPLVRNDGGTGTAPSGAKPTRAAEAWFTGGQ